MSLPVMENILLLFTSTPWGRVLSSDVPDHSFSADMMKNPASCMFQDSESRKLLKPGLYAIRYALPTNVKAA
jgi:hypothetical protein